MALEIGNAELYEAALEIFGLLTNEQRTELFAEFCVYCGDSNPKCPCMRDD